LEALWVTWGINKVNVALVDQLLNAKDYRARAAAVRVVRYNWQQLKNHSDIFKKAANDVHGRVRLEAIVAASWLDKKEAMTILEIANKKPLDIWMLDTYNTVIENFQSRIKKPDLKSTNDIVSGLKGKELEIYQKGRELYSKEGFCATCHQPDGRGVQASGFPPLANSKWVVEDPNRLIKLTLNGIMGPIEVAGKKYEGKTPMIPYAGLMKDEEVAAVLSYIRNSFSNKAPFIKPQDVKKVRAEIKNKKGFYIAADLLKEHPSW
jgi:mono/diheme cytochrome c family protein